jgi:tRNA (guanine-N7-)-methyltransferase
MKSRPGKVRPKTPADQLRQAGLLLEAPPPRRPLDLPAIFGNSRPVEMEIGSGKGAFLLRRGRERPEVNLLGVEWLGAYAHYAADRAFRAGLPNVRLLCADAAALLSGGIPPASLLRVHIYYPDPWPKRRHAARRLIQPGFLADVMKALRVGGWLGIVTDHEEYAGQIERVLEAAEGLVRIPFRPVGCPQGVVDTNFEAKRLGPGQRPFTFAAIRRGAG